MYCFLLQVDGTMSGSNGTNDAGSSPDFNGFTDINGSFDNNTMNDDTINGQDNTYHCQLYRFIMSVGVTGSLCVFGIVGNILTLLVFSKYNKSSSDVKNKSSAPLLLSGLAISDMILLLTLLIMKPVPAFVSFTHILTGLDFVSFFAFLFVYGWACVNLAQSINSWIIVVITVHRFIAIIFPHKATIHCTYKKAKLHLIIVTLAVCVYEFASFFDRKVLKFVDSNNKTYYIPVHANHSFDYWYQILYKTTSYYIVMYVIPWILLAVMTVFLVRAVRQARKFRSQMATNQADNTEDITKSLIAIVVMSLICRPWEPIRRLMEAMLGRQPGCGHYYFYYEEFPALTTVINSSVNFVLYCFFTKRFPETLKEMFKKTSQVLESYSMDTSLSNVTLQNED